MFGEKNHEQCQNIIFPKNDANYVSHMYPTKIIVFPCVFFQHVPMFIFQMIFSLFFRLGARWTPSLVSPWEGVMYLWVIEQLCKLAEHAVAIERRIHEFK